MTSLLSNNNLSYRVTTSLLVVASLFHCAGCERASLKEKGEKAVAPHEQAAALPLSPGEAAEAKEVVLVRNHQATCAIIAPEGATERIEDTIRRFVETVERSTGARIPVVRPGEEAGLAPEVARIYIGPSPRMEEMGLKPEELPEEGYRILTAGNALYLIGREEFPDIRREGSSSRPTIWATNHLLETGLGVRWLWPGRLGTYVPKHADFVVPPTDIAYQPKLLQRILRTNLRKEPLVSSESLSQLDANLKRETYEWSENHQTGRRCAVRFGHAFGDWWQKYGKEHPDYFGEAPEGMSFPPYDMPKRIKLRLSNPAVLDQIAKEYQEAGAPEYWNVCPNDGGGFDLSEATRAWDIPANQPLEAIWKAKANLTARYVMFWNLLHEKLKAINPDVKLATYAYGTYKTPPPAERPLKARAALGIVCGFYDYDLWKGWAAQEGTQEIFLRPNWGHIGANAPYLPLKGMAEFLKFAWENKMRGFDLDSLVGFWSTQGTSYYLWARLATRPDLTAEQILDEYTSAFGQGAGKIHDYFDYWQKLTKEYAYPESYASAGGAGEERSKFAQLVKEGKTEVNFVRGPRYALPYLYTDDVLAPAYRLLDEADAAIGDSDPEATERVAFLRDGLKELAATRDVIALARSIKRSSPKAMLEEFYRKSSDLEKLREELAPRHVIWGYKITSYEDRYRVPMRPRNMQLPELNMEGL